MSQASSFTPLTAVEASRATGWRASWAAGLEGAALVIPLSLGGVTLVFSSVGGAAVAGAVFTTLVALGLLQLATSHGRRPVVYSARFFEATTVAAMMDHAIDLMPTWNMHDAPDARLAVLLLLLGFAGAFVALLYAGRADRFTRHIPSPVFAGFSNGIAMVLLASQGAAFISLLVTTPVLNVVLPAVGALAGGTIMRQWLPRLPAAACGLAVGLAGGQLLALFGRPVHTLGTGASLVPPVHLADFGALSAPGADTVAIATWIALNAAVLGAMVFLNSSITAQALTHIDDRPRERPREVAIACACITVAGFAGAAPMSGSMQASLGTARRGDLGPKTMQLLALVLIAVACSGLLTLVPVAAVVGSLACEALYMIDRGTLRTLRRWMQGHPLTRHGREDLALVVAVTATAVMINMVAAVFAGVLLGLLLFASRHVTHPVRAVWDGTQLSSNCARSRADLQALTEHGHELRVVELAGDLFFGTQEQMDRRLRQVLSEAGCVVLDWSDVRAVDTSAAHALAKFVAAARTHHVPLVHVPATSAEAVGPLAFLDEDDIAPDLDHALERGENLLLEKYRPADADETAQADVMTLFEGLDEQERALLESRMTRRRFRTGEMIVRAGDPGDQLMVLLQGTASVMVPRDPGQLWRVAGMRRGGIIGEMAFLDRSPRSATVMANDDVLIAAIDHRDFDVLQAEAPKLAQKLLANIAMYLASRLRRTTRLASMRQSRTRT